MPVIAVPYHLDSRLPDAAFPLEPGHTVATPLPEGTPWERMALLYDLVASQVAAYASEETAEKTPERPAGHVPSTPRPPLVMSGDCTTSLGVVAGLQRSGRTPGVVWFDAHGDLHTPDSTTSGYLGGMPLRMLVGEGEPTVAEHLGLRPLPEHQVLLVDGRDLDPPEVEHLARSSIRRCAVGEIASDRLPDGPIYLHLDVDVAGPDAIPDLLFPAPGGPGLAAVAEAAQVVLATGRVAAVGLACTWRGGRAGASATRDLAERLLAAL